MREKITQKSNFLWLYIDFDIASTLGSYNSDFFQIKIMIFAIAKVLKRCKIW